LVYPIRICGDINKAVVAALANRNLELNQWLYSKLVIIIITITSFSFLEIIERTNSTVFPHSFIFIHQQQINASSSNPIQSMASSVAAVSTSFLLTNSSGNLSPISSTFFHFQHSFQIYFYKFT
jgi:hypothetical protein